MSQCFIPAKVTAYYALIRSSLEYCCSIFDPWRVTLTRALDGEGSKFRPHVSSWETVSDDLRFRTLKLGSAWTHCNPPVNYFGTNLFRNLTALSLSQDSCSLMVGKVLNPSLRFIFSIVQNIPGKARRLACVSGHGATTRQHTVRRYTLVHIAPRILTLPLQIVIRVPLNNIDSHVPHFCG